MTARKETELADRLAALGISAAELAAIVRRPVAEVETWIEGDAEPDAEARILLRVLDQDHVAELAAERVRHMRTMPLRGGDDWQTAGIDRPYGGGHAGTTGGQPE